MFVLSFGKLSSLDQILSVCPLGCEKCVTGESVVEVAF